MLVALPLFLHAQNKGDFEIGIGGGFNVAAFYGGDADRNNTRVGFQAGITGEYYVSDQWGFKSGLIYDTKGGKGDFVLSFGDALVLVEVASRLEYLFIPLYANHHFGKNNRWYLNFGPYLNILLAEESKGTGFEDGVRPLDFGLGAGLGYKFKISDKAAIFVEYQGARGFLEVFENGRDLFNTRSAFNAGIVLVP